MSDLASQALSVQDHQICIQFHMIKEQTIILYATGFEEFENQLKLNCMLCVN